MGVQELTPETTNEETPSTEETKTVEDTLYGEESKEEVESKEEDGSEERAESEATEEEQSKADESKAEEKSEEKSEDDWKLEMGEDWEINEDVVKQIEEFSKENGLSKEAAQKLLDNQNENIREYKQTQEDLYWKGVDEWETQLKEDKEFGGEKFNENVKLARKTFAKYVDTDTQKLFDEKGYGSYPGLVKAFAKLGRELFGDTIERGHSGDRTQKSIADMFYGES